MALIQVDPVAVIELGHRLTAISAALETTATDDATEAFGVRGQTAVAVGELLTGWNEKRRKLVAGLSEAGSVTAQVGARYARVEADIASGCVIADSGNGAS